MGNSGVAFSGPRRDEYPKCQKADPANNPRHAWCAWNPEPSNRPTGCSPRLIQAKGGGHSEECVAQQAKTDQENGTARALEDLERGPERGESARAGTKNSKGPCIAATGRAKCRRQFGSSRNLMLIGGQPTPSKRSSTPQVSLLAPARRALVYATAGSPCE